MTQSSVNSECVKLLEAIRRISGGNEITYKSLIMDEEVEQTFEAVQGTLKAARKRGLIQYEGEVLLQGQHDDVVITILEGADEIAAKLGTDDPEGQKPGNWQVDTSYIDWRTADPDRLEARGTANDVVVAEGPGSVNAQTATNVKKQEDGKWTAVDTNYIDWRTHDVERREARRTQTCDFEDPGMVAKRSEKTEEGKWKTVDVGYINYRTGDCDRLDGRKSTASESANVAVAAQVGEVSLSGTVKKDGEGKWKVDTSYINYRTKDTDNLEKKFGAQSSNQYADPHETKFSYDDLKKGQDDRDPLIDPSMKEKYLSEDEHKEVFGCTHDELSKMPGWKRQSLKKSKSLF